MRVRQPDVEPSIETWVRIGWGRMSGRCRGVGVSRSCKDVRGWGSCRGVGEWVVSIGAE